MKEKIVAVAILVGENIPMRRGYFVGERGVDSIEIFLANGDRDVVEYLRIRFECGSFLEIIKSACSVHYGVRGFEK